MMRPLTMLLLGAGRERLAHTKVMGSSAVLREDEPFSVGTKNSLFLCNMASVTIHKSWNLQGLDSSS